MEGVGSKKGAVDAAIVNGVIGMSIGVDEVNMSEWMQSKWVNYRSLSYNFAWFVLTVLSGVQLFK